jgi:phosphatidylserine/phosphatidylglycerophosphate/cardiolipin synthase-like enzyme
MKPGWCGEPGFFLTNETPLSSVLPALLRSARTSLRLVQYKITAKDVLQVLAEVMRKNAALVIDLLLDHEAARKKVKKWLRFASEFDGRAHFWVPRTAAKMHAKMIVVDNDVCLFGSSNLTRDGFTGDNIECFMVLTRASQPELVNQMISKLDHLFSQGVVEFDPFQEPSVQEEEVLAERGFERVKRALSAPKLRCSK